MNDTSIEQKEKFDEIIWCTHACGQNILRDSPGFKVDDVGFVYVDDF